MNFYELHAFTVLAEELHFGRAAEKLNMSPSALSRIISRLEDETHSSLLDRTNRQAVLSPEGRTFLKFAAESLEKQAETMEILAGTSGEPSGILHLYASVTACYTVLPNFIRQLAEYYPNIKLSIETGDPAGAIRAVKENRAAIAVAAIPESGLSTMETVSVLRTPLVYAAAKGGPYTDLEGSPQDIISSVPLILPKTGLARTRFDRWIRLRNVKPVIAAETEGNEAILAIAQLGLGIGLVPKIVLESGMYRDDFVIHAAANSLRWYDVGFIRKAEISGTKSNRLMQTAVSRVLRTFRQEAEISERRTEER